MSLPNDIQLHELTATLEACHRVLDDESIACPPSGTKGGVALVWRVQEAMRVLRSLDGQLELAKRGLGRAASLAAPTSPAFLVGDVRTHSGNESLRVDIVGLTGLSVSGPSWAPDEPTTPSAIEVQAAAQLAFDAPMPDPAPGSPDTSSSPDAGSYDGGGGDSGGGGSSDSF